MALGVWLPGSDGTSLNHYTSAVKCLLQSSSLKAFFFLKCRVEILMTGVPLRTI